MTEKDPLTHLVIGAAMSAHRELGPGLNEEIYHRLLSEKLFVAGVDHEFKPRRELIYRGVVADVFEPDIVIPNKLIPELKTLQGAFGPNQFTQVLAYLKLWKIPVGMLMDFAKESLIFKRVIAPSRLTVEFPEIEIPDYVVEKPLAAQLLNFLRDIHRDHGVGYHENTYRGLMLACICDAGISQKVDPNAMIEHLGSTTLRCIEVAGQCAIKISALGNGLAAADRAILQTYLKWLNLPWGIAIHFGKRACDVQFVKCPGNY